MLYFDTHAHYDWKEFDDDRNEKYQYMYYSIGIHPMEVEKEISINLTKE